MKYAGSSIVTTRQVGSTGVVVENDSIYNVTITQTKSTKSGSGSVIVYYLTAEFPNKWFAAGEVSDNATAAKAGMPII